MRKLGLTGLQGFTKLLELIPYKEDSISIGLLLFCVIGLLKGLVTKTSLFRSIIETFLLGSSAACISYLVGYALKNITN